MFFALYPLKHIGSEFMPPLNEGDLLYMPTTLPGISITKAKELLQQTDKIIKSFPEVHHVFGKVGRAETATDPAPLSMLETTITLKPEEEWREGMTMEKLTEELDKAIQFPGVTNAWTMPIKTRIDMLSTGIKTPVGIKIAGEDLNVLEKLGEQIEAVMQEVPGTLSAYAERVVGGNYLDYEIDRTAAARYGLTVGDVQDVIMTAIGGTNVPGALPATLGGVHQFAESISMATRFSKELENLRAPPILPVRLLLQPLTQFAIPQSFISALKLSTPLQHATDFSATRQFLSAATMKTADIFKTPTSVVSLPLPRLPTGSGPHSPDQPGQGTWTEPETLGAAPSQVDQRPESVIMGGEGGGAEGESETVKEGQWQLSDGTPIRSKRTDGQGRTFIEVDKDGRRLTYQQQDDATWRVVKGLKGICTTRA